MTVQRHYAAGYRQDESGESEAMAVERLHFGPTGMTYRVLIAAEHLVRYDLAARYCTGRRVLDVACGEGYGSRLLAKAGARGVVGVDVSAEAIRKATEFFAAHNIRYVESRAEDLQARLGQKARFDLVVSFDTIEHVQDVSAFLQAIRELAAPGAVIMISCPREPALPGEPSPNPFHRRTFSLESFQAETTRVLGSNVRWFLGAPAQGALILELGSRLLGPGSLALDEMLRYGTADHATLLPAEHNLRVNATNCTFFLGVWGAECEIAAVMAPMSASGLTEPWKKLDWLAGENARLLRELVAARGAPHDGRVEGERTRMLVSIADLQRAELLGRQRLEAANERTSFVSDELARHAREMEGLRDHMQLLSEENTRLQDEAEHTQSELQWLRAIEKSRSWRVALAIQRLYARPLLGLPLRTARHVLSDLCRAFSGP